jgi:hypothetical protein
MAEHFSTLNVVNLSLEIAQEVFGDIKYTTRNHIQRCKNLLPFSIETPEEATNRYIMSLNRRMKEEVTAQIRDILYLQLHSTNIVKSCRCCCYVGHLSQLQATHPSLKKIKN